MPKVYFATRAELVEFDRVCSNCEHKWTASFDVGVRSDIAGSKEQADKSAKEFMAVEKKERSENRDVLCPQCSHFSVDAMYRHFRKGGYAAGILKKYKQAMWMNLLAVLGFVWLPALLVFLADLNVMRENGSWLSIVWLLIVVGLGGISLYKFIGFVWGIVALPSLRRKLNQLSDNQLLDLAVSCYKGNKDSMDSTSLGEQIKWNAWLTRPLSYKATPASGREVTQ